jgi:hypothetical protein
MNQPPTSQPVTHLWEIDDRDLNLLSAGTGTSPATTTGRATSGCCCCCPSCSSARASTVPAVPATTKDGAQ